jgi:hypothetical protein
MTPEPAPDAHVTLKIPRPLYERLKQVIAESGFHSVTEFAVYVLRDLVTHHAESPKDVEPLSPEEIEQVRKRLESLGYL